MPRGVGLVELFVAVLIVGISCINLALPALAYRRSGDGRFLALSGANALLVLIGTICALGELPVDPPGWTIVPLAVLALLLLVTLLLLASTLWPRRA